MKPNEKVLAFPASVLDRLGKFQGIMKGKKMSLYLEEILHSKNLTYIDRAEAEEDPSWKQVIPYTVLFRGYQPFRYLRTKKGGETRLHDKWSIGVGGHINPEDGQPGESAYYSAFLRELREEVSFEENPRVVVMGLLYDDSDPVGQVHFGVVHFLQMGNYELKFNDPALSCGHFDLPGNIRGDAEKFENWSKYVIQELL